MPPLAGRTAECQELDRLLEAARDGLSAVLVMRGEPGIGKTALLEHAAQSATDFEVARVSGIESEVELGYAGLHQMLLPFLPRTDVLPAPQRHALDAAFGLVGGPPPSPFLITLAVLTLVAHVAADRPLLCIVDDAQWIDEESMTALASVARRLHADGIAMIITVREPAARRVPLERLPTLEVTGLPPDAAREVVLAALDTRLPARHRIADRIVSESRGNPLGLLALAKDVTPDDLGERAALMNPIPIGSRLEARYRLQTRSLPNPTQTLLLTAAADPTGNPDLLWHAGELLAFGPSDAGVPGLGELLDIATPIAFHHPLVRSAIYYASTPAERRRVHAALADVTNPVTDQDRRAWHRAASTVDVDEQVAQELEAAASRARERGGLAGAAALLERAAHLTPESSTRAERLVVAAEAEWMAGSEARTLGLVKEAAPHIADPSTRARARRLEAAVMANRTSGLAPWLQLITEARGMTAPDGRFVRSTLLDALAANMPFLEPVEELARIGLTVPLAPGHEPTAPDLLLDGLCLAFGQRDDAAAAPLLRRSFAELDFSGQNPIDAYTLLLCGCMGAAAIGDFDALRDIGHRLESFGRELGAPLPVYIGQSAIVSADHGTGDLASALRRWNFDGQAIRDAMPPEMFIGDVAALAWRGDEQAARALETQQARWMADHNRIGYQPLLDWALGVLEIGLGNYDAAYERSNAARSGAYLFRDQVMLDLVEAAARTDRTEVAHATVDQIAGRAQVNDTPLFAGFLARSRALVADDGRAESLYREAIDRFQVASAPLHIARAQLVYGEWLRRQKRRTDARDQLADAYNAFLVMGAGAFAERARNELAAAGQTLGKRKPDTSHHLTPQEERIARLAATGDTNAEIAEKMFLSSATVEYHLRKVYRKLGITSRRHLRNVF